MTCPYCAKEMQKGIYHRRRKAGRHMEVWKNEGRTRKDKIGGLSPFYF